MMCLAPPIVCGIGPAMRKRARAWQRCSPERLPLLSLNTAGERERFPSRRLLADVYRQTFPSTKPNFSHNTNWLKTRELVRNPASQSDEAEKEKK